MAASNLLPPMLCKKWSEENGTPYLALLAGSIIGYFVCLVAYFVPAFGKVVVNVALLAAYMVYLAQCLGFVQAKRAFKNLPRDFVSPLGIFGGVYAGTIFLACIVSVVAFQDDSHLAIFVFVGIILVLSGYYLVIAKAKQNLSDEERKVLYVAHIVKCECQPFRFFKCLWTFITEFESLQSTYQRQRRQLQETRCACGHVARRSRTWTTATPCRPRASEARGG